MDGRRGAVVGEPAGRVRPGNFVRRRTAFACDGGSVGYRLIQNAAALLRFALAALAAVWAAFAPVPNVLIASDGRTFAVRGPAGRLAFHHNGGDSFAIREWLAADADGRDVHDRSLGGDIACDPSGCIGKLADDGLVAYGLEPDAFEEDDCRRAAIVIAPHDDPPADCHATVIGRALWRARGVLTLRREASGLVMQSARSKNFDRPWSPAAASTARPPLPDAATKPVEDGIEQHARSDATPRQDDIEADE